MATSAAQRRPRRSRRLAGLCGTALAGTGVALAILVPGAGNAAVSHEHHGAAHAASSSITLGELGPLTGSRASIGAAMVIGAKLALKSVNANGGVLGHQVVLDSQDDANDPADAVPAADKEINSDHVVAIVGPIIQTAPVVLPLAAKANIPMLMYGGGSTFDQETSPYFFRLSPSDTEQAYAMMVYAHQRGWNRVSIAIGNTTGDTSLLPGMRYAAKKLHMKILTTVTVAVGSTSLSSEISNLFAQHPQAIVGQFDIASAGVMFGELQQRNLLSTPWVVTNLWFASEFVSSVSKPVAAGPIYIANPGVENGGYGPFLGLLKKDTGQSQPQNGETYMYDAVNLWALGAAVSGTYKYPELEHGIVSVANGTGKHCTSYAACIKLQKEHKQFKYVGAASSTTFDKYHNVFGPFDILRYTSSGATRSVASLTATQIQTDVGK